MLNKGMSKAQIEDELKNKGDFVKIDYLTRFLKEELSLDMKKFVYLTLANIYEKIKMLDNACMMLDNAALNSIAYSEKIKWYLKEAELYIRKTDFDKVDEVTKKAMFNANASQKAEIYFQIKIFLIRQAEIYEKEIKRNNASKIYERLLKMKLNINEKKEITEKLIELYKKLGRFKEIEKLENIHKR